MTTPTSVWDDTYRWSGAVYAPDVPLRERQAFLSDGLLPRKIRMRRFRARWAERALLLADAEFATYHGMEGATLYEVYTACTNVWQAAKPLAGVVDVHELEYRLSDELWTCAQLGVEIGKLRREFYDTKAAEKVLVGQVAERHRRLLELRDEYVQLLAEGGADPSTVNDIVREALLRAQSLEDHRPIEDSVMWTKALRDIVVQHKQSATGEIEGSR